MAESAALIGYGSIFEISTDDGTTYISVGEVTDITPPSDSLDVIDVTHMQSPNRTREYIVGLRDPGECSFEIAFVPGSPGDLQIQTVRDAGERVTCRITYPNDVTWTFSGLLTGYEPTVPTGEKMSASVTFKVTSSYTTGTAPV